MNQPGKIVSYEYGEGRQEEMIAFFREFIDPDFAKQLQGHRKYTASALFDKNCEHTTTTKKA